MQIDLPKMTSYNVYDHLLSKNVRGHPMKNSQDNLDYRRQNILAYLQEYRIAKVSALSTYLKVSELTIRRDLKILESMGCLLRIPGGAHLKPEVAPCEPASNTLLCKKNAIAFKASTLINNGDCIFINSSSTALLIYKYIQNIKATIITNNGNSLQAPLGTEIELILTGGEVSKNKHSLVGQHASHLISQVACNKCIIGISGISPSRGMTTTLLAESTINNAMLRYCNGDVIVVADSSKIGQTNKFFTGDIQNITHLITDVDADKKVLKELENIGVQIIVVEY